MAPQPAGPRPPAIEPARVEWRDGVPYAPRFEDVYFSRENGLEESRHVFLRHNHLSERFADVPEGGHFVIAETGFGTGLNFLAAVQLWLNSGAADNATLHFISFERFPLTPDDLLKAHAHWPELTLMAQQLQDQYPPLVHGLHRLCLAGGRIRLSLWFGDALEGLRDTSFRANAWFLDGFAPARNPDLWIADISSEIRRHSDTGTTLATFTAVGRIRRGLAETGFGMTKVAGFGRKREMLIGELRGECAPPSNSSAGDNVVTVVGAGIAGTLLACNLAERGHRVRLIDAGPGPGAGASGNLQGALYVKLGVDLSPQTQLALSSLLFSQRYYGLKASKYWHPSGLLQLATTHSEADRQRRFSARNQYPRDILIPVSPAEASELAGAEIGHPGLYFPGSGWLEPGRLCAGLASQSGIEVITHGRVHDWRQQNDRWVVHLRDGRVFDTDKLVLAVGADSPLLGQGQWRLKTIRGQVSHLPADALAAPLKRVVCGNRYLNPPHKGQALLGATFDLRDSRLEVCTMSHEENLAALREEFPALAGDLPEPEMLSGRVGFRCTTHDYQPVAGRLPDGTFLFTGLGSKGLSYAPLLAEFLADLIVDQPAALPESLAARVAPFRIVRPVADSP